MVLAQKVICFVEKRDALMYVYDYVNTHSAFPPKMYDRL